VSKGVKPWCNAGIGFEKTSWLETYFGASSGIDGNEANVARMVVSSKRSRYDCQALLFQSFFRKTANPRIG
jgi:hypothetical protein